MSQTVVSVGVIGVGSMGQHHARIMASLPGVKFIGVADVDLPRARDVANAHGVQAFQDHRDLLEQVEAVSIAAPTVHHYSLAMDCLRRGIRILVEKPLTSTVQEAKELSHAATAAGALLQVGHVERFNPTFTEMAKVLSKKRLVALEARRLSPFVPRAADVSAVLDLMVHDLDLALELVHSPVTSLQAMGLRAKVPCLDHVTAHLMFQDGVVANLTASKISQQKVRDLTAICDDCVVQADLLARTVVVHREATSSFVTEGEHVAYRQEGLVEQVYVPMVEPLYAELASFVECVREGKRPVVGPEEAILVLELAEAIEKAAAASLAAGPKAQAQPSQASP